MARNGSRCLSGQGHDIPSGRDDFSNHARWRADFMGEPEPEGNVLICRDVTSKVRVPTGERPGPDGVGAERDEGVGISWTRHYGSGSHDCGLCGKLTA